MGEMEPSETFSLAETMLELAIGTEGAVKPQKKYFRQRAHGNPLSDCTIPYPLHPDCVDWNEAYPTFNDDGTGVPVPPGDSVGGTVGRVVPAAGSNDQAFNNIRRPDFVDVGCGFGGLTVALARDFPDKLVLGMELRDKVASFVHQRIHNLRVENPGKFNNAAIVRANCMKFMPNFFPKASLEKMFFCFPDPHFKRANHRRRIISDPLLAEYCYFLKDGAILYTITDVLDLHEWMDSKCDAHPLLEKIPSEEAEKDPCVALMRVVTEEGQKVARNEGSKFVSIFRRIPRK